MNFNRIGRFGFAGVASTLFYLVATMFLTEVVEVGPTSASVYAYLAALVVSYMLQSRFVFRVFSDNRAQIVRFAVTSASGLAVSYGVMTLAVDGLGLHTVLGAIAVCVLIPVMNFFLLSRWVFLKRQSVDHQ